MAKTTVGISLEATTTGAEKVKQLKEEIRQAEQAAKKVSKEFGESSKEAQAAKEKVTGLKTGLEPLIQSTKSFKAQLREATQEALRLAQEFGEFSPQAQAATARVAELKDQMEDFQNRVAGVNPDKFSRIAGITQGIARGIQGATGAMALFGVESETAQKALVKVQAATAFADGVQGLIELDEKMGGFAKKAVAGFKGIRGAVAATGIGLLALGLTALIANFDKVKDAVLNFIPGLREVGKVIGNLITSFTDWIGLTSQAERDLEKLEKRTKTMNEANDRQIKILEAEGGKENEIYKLKRKNIDGEIAILEKKRKIHKKLTDEEHKELLDLYAAGSALSKAERKRIDDNAKEAADKAKQEAEQQYKDYVARLKAQADAERNSLQQLNAEKRKLRELNAKNEKEVADTRLQNELEALKESRENELRADNLTAAAKANINSKFDTAESIAKINHQNALAKIEKDAEQKRIEQRKQFEQDAKAIADAEFESNIAAINKLYAARESAAAQDFLNGKIKAEQYDAELAKIEADKNARLIQEAKDYGKDTTDLQKQVLDKQVQQKKEADQKQIDSEKQKLENIKNAQRAELELTAQGFAAIGELAETFAGQSEAQQKKAFEIKKKASIAQAIVETLMAAQSAYASQMAIPTPDAPIRATIAAALAVAAGIGRVKKIEQTKFESKSGAAGGGGGGGNNPNAPNTTPVTGGLLPDMEQPGGFAGMGRVYVLEGDITKTQTRVRRVRNVSVV